jgi:hypothetical protein
MKYYRLIYSYKNAINNFIEDCKEDFEGTPEENIKEAKKYVIQRYAWYQEGVIYSEDETILGEAIRVSDLVEMFPEDWEEVSTLYKLDSKGQMSKHCKDGKDRNLLSYFLNDIKIFQQKIPFNEDYEKGFDRRISIYDEYILNNKMYQTRYDDDTKKKRQVSFPLSKERLKQFNIPKDFKIVANSDCF